MAETSKRLDALSLVDLAMDDQARVQRIIEMARIIEEVSDDLPPDTESSRLRVCAQVIYETADRVIADLERMEVSIRPLSRLPNCEIAA